MKISLTPGEFYQLLLSHHPDCDCFKDDVIIIGGYRLCAGCVMAYPIAIALLILIWPVNRYSVYIAIIFAMISLLRKFIKNKKIKIVLRGVAGLALGFGFGGLIWAVEQQDVLSALILILGAAVYGSIRAYSVKKKLLKCKCGHPSKEIN